MGAGRVSKSGVKGMGQGGPLGRLAETVALHLGATEEPPIEPQPEVKHNDCL